MEKVTLNHEDVTMTGELYLPAGDGPHPTVLIYHSALALKAHEREIARRLTALGYAALAVDMYGATDLDDEQEAGAYFMELGQNPEKLRERTVAWFDHAALLDAVDAGRMAAIGYCFGGMCVLELARSGRGAKACVSFHGILKTHAPAEEGAVQGEVVAWCGGQDPYAPMGQIDDFRAEMAEAQAAHQITIFGQVPHGFSDRAMDRQRREGIGYDALADAVSWAGTVALLEKLLKA